MEEMEALIARMTERTGALRQVAVWLVFLGLVVYVVAMKMDEDLGTLDTATQRAAAKKKPRRAAA